ncbi:hypothetical protein PU02_0549 [Bartonella ancashensis]|uniref:Uncharacterized protein n=1 Tax=Bartonella ancashensis TaxID=1318743 RepID=A0A0M4L7S8_9HYPH|nr:hypothetical protein PU02_0549 [Bartonella ancashensis]
MVGSQIGENFLKGHLREGKTLVIKSVDVVVGRSRENYVSVCEFCKLGRIFGVPQFKV